VFYHGNLTLSKIEWDLGVPVILRVESLSVEVSLEIVSHDVDLLPASEEGLGGGNISNVSETKDIGVFLVSKGLGVNLEKPIL